MKAKSYTISENAIGAQCYSKVPQYLTAAAVSLSGFCIGTALGWSSPALPKILRAQSIHDLDPTHLPWIGSILTLGAALGALVAGLFGIDLIGRKGSLLVSSLVFFGGWLFLSLAQEVSHLIYGRFLTGFAVGSLSLIAPIFLTEISQPSVRGVIGVAFQLMAVLGCLFSTVLGTLHDWQFLSQACTIAPLLYGLGVLFLPESPRFLLKNSKTEEARKAFIWFRNSSEEDFEKSFELRKEYEEMQDGITKVQESHTLFSYLSPTVFKPILITICLIIFNQICGINAVNFYTVDIFKTVKIGRNTSIPEGSNASSIIPEEETASYVSAILVQAVQVGAVFLSSVLVDSWGGRRRLLMMSFGIMTVSHVAVGGTFYFSQVPSCMAVVGVIFANVGYSIGIGSLVWTMMSEILPLSVVGKVYSFETSLNWILAFVVTRYFHVLNEALAIYNTFWIFALCCFMSGIVVHFTVPETKGKTLEQIQEDYFIKKGSPKSDSKCDSV